MWYKMKTETDATPIASSTSVANNFVTSAGTDRVKVNLGYTPPHTVSVGDRIEFTGVDNFAGTSVNGNVCNYIC